MERHGQTERERERERERGTIMSSNFPQFHNTDFSSNATTFCSCCMQHYRKGQKGPKKDKGAIGFESPP